MASRTMTFFNGVKQFYNGHPYLTNHSSGPDSRPTTANRTSNQLFSYQFSSPNNQSSRPSNQLSRPNKLFRFVEPVTARHTQLLEDNSTHTQLLEDNSTRRDVPDDLFVATDAPVDNQPETVTPTQSEKKSVDQSTQTNERIMENQGNNNNNISEYKDPQPRPKPQFNSCPTDACIEVLKKCSQLIDSENARLASRCIPSSQISTPPNLPQSDQREKILPESDQREKIHECKACSSHSITEIEKSPRDKIMKSNQLSDKNEKRQLTDETDDILRECITTQIECIIVCQGGGTKEKIVEVYSFTSSDSSSSETEDTVDEEENRQLYRSQK